VGGSAEEKKKAHQWANEKLGNQVKRASGDIMDKHGHWLLNLGRNWNKGARGGTVEGEKGEKGEVRRTIRGLSRVGQGKKQ